MRTIIDIPENQLKALTKICKQKKISRAEIIRKAIDSFLKESKMNGDISQPFGIWKNKKKDALKFQQKLREEW